jgi:hypothetical protein
MDIVTIIKGGSIMKLNWYTVLKGCAFFVVSLVLVGGSLSAKNLIKNGEFDDGLTYWQSGWINTSGGASVSFAVNSDFLLSGENCYEMNIETGGSNSWDIQRTQSLPLQAGVDYVLTFMGMQEGSADPISIWVAFENGDPDYYKYLYEEIVLTGSPTEYGPFEYLAEEDDPAVELKFFPGAHDAIYVYLDAIVVDDGEPEVDQIATLNDVKPAEFSLKQNYPNPFNSMTQIQYAIPNESQVSLVVFDLLGKTVCTLVDESQPAGMYKVDFNAQDLPGGVYVYRFQAGDFSTTRKMVYLK